MGLKVRVYTGQFGTAEWKLLDSEVGEHLAGPESTRQELWGSVIMRSIGLELLPTLATNNLHLSGHELGKLENELKLVESKANEISAYTNIDEYALLVIIKNILKAIDRAKEINGGVLIW
jgi:hypothetical protein